MSDISSDMVRKIADLSKLELEDSEIDRYKSQLDKILDYFGLLSEFNAIEGEESTTPTPEREDILDESTKLEEAMRLAPKSSGSSFEVPKVIS